MSYPQLGDRFRDVAFATATPFSNDGERIRHGELRDNLRYLADHGANVFVPCGNTASTTRSITTSAWRSCGPTPRRSTTRRRSSLASAGAPRPRRSSSTGTRMREADAVMVMHPDHTYVHEQGLVEYYRRLAASTDLGIVVYKRGPELSKRVLTEVAGVDNTVAVKYAVDDIDAFSQTVAAAPDDVVWLNGIAERYALSFAIEGTEGFSTGVGNFAPEATLELFAAVERRDWERA